MRNDNGGNGFHMVGRRERDERKRGGGGGGKQKKKKVERHRRGERSEGGKQVGMRSLV